MTHILSTRRRQATPPELPEANHRAAFRSSTRPAWPLGRWPRSGGLAPTEAALVRARSEAAVDALLATLPDDWAAFSSSALVGNGTSAVRVLVGPGGVFALHAQPYEGRIAWVHGSRLFVTGQGSPNLALVETGAHELTALLRERMPLRIAVQPAVVVLGPRALWVTGRSMSGAAVPVTILGQATLGDWLAARPHVLRPVERMELAAVIDNPRTWGVRPSIAPSRPRPGSAGEEAEPESRQSP